MLVKMTSINEYILEIAQKVLLIESQAIERSALNLSQDFIEAVKILQKCKGKVIFTGMGKSGHIAQKISSTFSSTGTSAFFLHPSEALHGDFGMIGKDDCLVAIAYGGETREVVAVAKFVKRENIPIISITGKPNSTLACLSDFTLDGSTEKEADSIGIAPTSSSTVALALGDALAVVLMTLKGFTKEKFAMLHPGGSIGRSLAAVSDFMHPLEKLHVISDKADFYLVVDAITKFNFGITAVVDEESRLLGCVSDGDIRRALLNHREETLKLSSQQLMSSKVKTIEPTARAIDAIAIMEKFKITSLFVTAKQHLVGLVRLHDLISANII